MRHSILISTTVVLSACALTSSRPSETSGHSTAEVRAFYTAYEAALKAHRRDTLAQFYHPDGATVVLNGGRMELTFAGVDSLYRGQWQGPAFFAFDSLHVQPLGPSSVLVTGGFKWLPPESRDTGQYIYLSILERTAEGHRIRVEHETLRPR